MARGPLVGLKIVEFAGIGPGPFAAMMLADYGAEVIRIARPDAPAPKDSDVLLRNRATRRIDLKTPAGRTEALDIIDASDALIEGFRPGVMERLGLGPDVTQARNARLIYARMTGYGQDGPMRHAAGHDITYTAMSGALSMIGPPERPVVPLNLVADFGGGAMMLVAGLLAGLFERTRSGKGQVLDVSMVDGAALLTAMFHGFRANGRWDDARGVNFLDGSAPFYTSYRCACGHWIAVGAIEPEFYAELLALTGLDDDPLFSDQNDRRRWHDQERRLADVFRSASREEWCTRAETRDACIAPILTLSEAPVHPVNRARGTFATVNGVVQPAPVPRFERSGTMPLQPGWLIPG